jgi:hypothetical protein
MTSKRTSAHLTSRPAVEEVAAVHGNIRTFITVSLVDVQTSYPTDRDFSYKEAIGLMQGVLSTFEL